MSIPRYAIAIYNDSGTIDEFNFKTEEEMLKWKEKHITPLTTYDEIDRLEGTDSNN